MPAEKIQEQLDSDRFALSPQQINFFEDFGFLHLKGLFADEIRTITEGFEEVFAEHSAIPLGKEDRLHYNPDPGYEGETRMIIAGFMKLHAKLEWLLEDDRILGIARTLVGEEFRYDGSDGNLMNCNVNWHADTYQSPLEFKHIKLMFYLDALDSSNGSLRVIPGTNHWDETFANRLRNKLPIGRIRRVYGVEPEEIPGFSIDVQPGDVIVDNFRTLHASFNGKPGRRLFTMNYGEPRP